MPQKSYDDAHQRVLKRSRKGPMLWAFARAPQDSCTDRKKERDFGSRPAIFVWKIEPVLVPLKQTDQEPKEVPIFSGLP